ncbi:MAG: hypothetical protein AAF518_27915 [Spirochaetota bacterium]
MFPQGGSIFLFLLFMGVIFFILQGLYPIDPIVLALILGSLFIVYLFRTLFSKTYILLKSNQLIVKTSFFFIRQESRKDLEQITDIYIDRYKDEIFSGNNYYSLRAKLLTGKEITLLGKVISLQRLDFIRKRISQHLQIPETKVASSLYEEDMNRNLSDWLQITAILAFITWEISDFIPIDLEYLAYGILALRFISLLRIQMTSGQK